MMKLGDLSRVKELAGIRETLLSWKRTLEAVNKHARYANFHAGYYDPSGSDMSSAANKGIVIKPFFSGADDTFGTPIILGMVAGGVATIDKEVSQIDDALRRMGVEPAPEVKIPT